MSSKADFQMLIRGLQQLGLSVQDIARLTESSNGSIHRMISGKTSQPNYQTGRHIVRLYKRLVMRELTAPDQNPSALPGDEQPDEN